ncbi:unnamed protein product [Urochloa decumbens]|uniref:Uncharacterized protein n=1 Tax=Urochloa decumbens TaxID=240449 RepID=A0ABC9FSZ7_9POAL
MGALSDAKPLLAIAAGGLHLHPAVLAFVTLAAAALISRRIIPCLDFLVVRRPAAGGPRPLLHPAGGTVEAAAAPAGSAPRSLLAHFVVLCVAMATAMHAEPLVHAAAELRLIGPGAVICGGLAAAALFSRVIVSVNHHFVAPRPAEREPKTPPPPLHLRPADPAAASTTRPPSSSSLARPAFAVLAALTSASWFVEPFASAAAELRLHRVAVVIAVLLFAALFNLSVRSFGSFFRTRRPPVAAARWEWQGPGVIAVAVMSAAVAACLVAAAGGSAYVYAPARS